MTGAALLLAVAGPRGLVGAPDAAHDPLAPYLLGFAVGTALLACVLAAWAMWTHRRALPDEERAFRVLARRLGLGRGEREGVRLLAAAHGSARPVALLLSDAALAEALEELQRQVGLGPRERALAEAAVHRLRR